MNQSSFRLFGSLLLGIVLMFAACKENAPVKPCDPASQELEIQEYITANNLTTKTTESGLHYIIEEPGSQVRPTTSSTVSVKYTGTLTDGTQFDSSGDVAVNFALAGVIAGWTEGIQLFKKGGKGTLIIPCQLGYGARAVGSIPPSSVLVFDIELLDVK